MEEAHRNLVCVADIKGHPKQLETSVLSFASHELSVVKPVAAVTCSKAQQCRALSRLHGGECGSGGSMHSGELMLAEMAALQGILDCSALGYLSLCAEFCFGFEFLSPLKAL